MEKVPTPEPLNADKQCAFYGKACLQACMIAHQVEFQRDHGGWLSASGDTWGRNDWERFSRNVLTAARAGCIRQAEVEKAIGDATQMLETGSRLIG